jgi:hypothetical protein
MAEIKGMDNVDFPVTAINSVPFESITAINSVTVPQGFYNDVITNSCIYDDPGIWYMQYQSGVAQHDNIRQACFSFWIKRHELANRSMIVCWYNNTNNNSYFEFQADDTLRLIQANGGSVTHSPTTTQVFRDCSGWYHMHLKLDTAQAAAADRFVLHVNGIDMLQSNATIAQNEVTTFAYGLSYTYYINRYGNSGYRGSFSLADIHYMGDSVLTDYTDFGEFKDGIWIPKLYEGSYGTDGFHLDFKDIADLGNDVSGEGSDFTLTNMLDSFSNSVDNPENNHCTLDYNIKYTTIPLRYGGTDFYNANSTWYNAASTFVMETGKWYWECSVGSDTAYLLPGVMQRPNDRTGDICTYANHLYIDANWFGIYMRGVATYQKYTNSAAAAFSPVGANAAASDIIQFAYDADAGYLWFGVNDVWFNSGDPANGTNPIFTGLSGPIVPVTSVHSHLTNVFNFGQRGLYATRPTGFNSLCTANLDIPSMIKPDEEAMNTVIWTGDSAATKAITGVGFSPDMVLIKARSGATTNFVLTDTVRGVDLGLAPNGNIVETDQATTGYLQSFDADGFTLNYGGGTPTYTHRTGYTYVGWCWKMGAEYGLDIQTYTGDGIAGKTVAHDLGAVPEMMIVKNRVTNGTEWMVYHHEMHLTAPKDYYLLWDESGGRVDQVVMWNDTVPTSSVFTVGTNSNVNESGIAMVAYLFASIEGYSRAFSFVGNGNAAGPYVYLGFRPAFIMYKNAQGANNWRIYDTVRNPVDGVALKALYPDLNNVEATADGISIDIDANGFKIKVNTAFINTNNDYFIGMAFAGQPFKYANAKF